MKYSLIILLFLLAACRAETPLQKAARKQPEETWLALQLLYHHAMFFEADRQADKWDSLFNQFLDSVDAIRERGDLHESLRYYKLVKGFGDSADAAFDRMEVQRRIIDSLKDTPLFKKATKKSTEKIKIE